MFAGGLLVREVFRVRVCFLCVPAVYSCERCSVCAFVFYVCLRSTRARGVPCARLFFMCAGSCACACFVYARWKRVGPSVQLVVNFGKVHIIHRWVQRSVISRQKTSSVNPRKHFASSSTDPETSGDTPASSLKSSRRGVVVYRHGIMTSRVYSRKRLVANHPGTTWINPRVSRVASTGAVLHVVLD